jgi:hypothetical protein
LTDRLYLNEIRERGVLAFRDASAGLGPGRLRDGTSPYGCAVAVGDVDNDGRPDLYLANLGPNQLLRNLGGGAFEEVTARAGVGDAGSSVVATFFDYDADGWLDLFVGNNMAFDNSGKVVCRSLTGARDYCGPGAYPSQPDRLYRGRGDGTFEDATVASGLAAATPVPTLGAVAADVDGDGWTDLYVANDGQPNTLWLNRRDGTFEEKGLLAGAAVNGAGASEASMGVDAGDYDGDGDLDLFLSHLTKETNTLYRNRGGLFEDVSQASGLGPPSRPFTGFGTAFLDYDGDGRLDLVVVNGAVTLVPALVQAGDPFPLHQTNQLFHNVGGPSAARFEEVTARAGPAFQLSEVSRGAAVGDVDLDGDADVVVANNGGPARLLLNRVGNRAPWLGLRLLEGEPGRDVPGATAELIRRAAPSLLRRVAMDGSYGSAQSPWLLFGLSQGTELVEVRVRWPGGAEEVFPPPAVGSYSEIRRGQGSPVAPGGSLQRMERTENSAGSGGTQHGDP